jgi:hypothetical protein
MELAKSVTVSWETPVEIPPLLGSVIRYDVCVRSASCNGVKYKVQLADMKKQLGKETRRSSKLQKALCPASSSTRGATDDQQKIQKNMQYKPNE